MRKKLFILGLILFGAVLLSGCTGPIAWPGLSANGQTAYLANGLYVYSLNLSDGKQNWQYPLQSNSKLAFYSNPVVAPNGLVIFGSSGVDRSLFAVDPTKFPNTPVQPVSGVQKFFCNIGLASCPEYKVEQWVFSNAKDHWVASPLILNDKVFAPNADGNLYVLDLNKGTLIQKITLNGDTKGPNRLWSQPITDGKMIFVTSLDRSVFAIDPATYKVVWHEDLSAAIPGGAVLGSDGALYVGSLAQQLEKFDPATGKHEAVVNTNGWIWGTPLVDGDNIYFGTINGYFYSYNTKAGKLNWDPIKPDAKITATPLLVGDHLLVATESGNIYAVSQDGKISPWYQVQKGKAYTTPIAAGDFLLAAYVESDYILVALDNNGNKKWTFPAGK